MDELYMNFNQSPSMVSPPGVNYQSMAAFGDVPIFATDDQYQVLVSNSSVVSDEDEVHRRSHDDDDHISIAIRAKIAQHPLYPRLVQAYVDCQKVGAPPEIVSLLDKILQESNVCKVNSVVSSSCFGADPELDEFMEIYCNSLVKFKSDVSEPFNEATTFLSKIEMQLKDLCNGASKLYLSDEAVESSEEDLSCGEIETLECHRTSEDRELKDKLLRKYSGYISTLKQEFSKKKKRGKLPIEARQILLNWWNIHYKWPYPTEGDKIALAEVTGLDQKQINNWFINRRKRHWKPSESMQIAVMDNICGPFYENG